MEKLILIHGALGNGSEFNDIIPFLNKDYEVVVYEIPHHNKDYNGETAFLIRDIVQDFLQFLKQHGSAYIYGFSLGGYIAIAAAIQDESNIKGIITQGTQFKWSPERAKIEIENLGIDFLSQKVKSFYDYLDELHGEFLPDLLDKTKGFMLELGNNPIITPDSIKNIKVPVRITLGGRDKAIPKDETLEIHEALSNSFYFEVPGMVHPLGFIRPNHIARLISNQLSSFSYQWTPTPFGKMAYQVIGEIDNDTDDVLLLLHESLGSINQWQNFPKNLCKALNKPGIVIELPGYAFSDAEDKVRNERYLHEFSWDVIPAFIKAIDLKNPLIIIGHSDGGTNALLYSSKYPEQVKSIVTLAAHYINEEETRAGIPPAIKAYEEGKLYGLNFFHGLKTERLFHAWSQTWLAPSFRDWDISDDIRGNTVSALIMQGDNDQYGTDQQVHGIVDLLPNSKAYFIKNCGHAPHLEKEGEVIQAIQDFLK